MQSSCYGHGIATCMFLYIRIMFWELSFIGCLPFTDCVCMHVLNTVCRWRSGGKTVKEWNVQQGNLSCLSLTSFHCRLFAQILVQFHAYLVRLVAIVYIKCDHQLTLERTTFFIHYSLDTNHVMLGLSQLLVAHPFSIYTHNTYTDDDLMCRLTEHYTVCVYRFPLVLIPIILAA